MEITITSENFEKEVLQSDIPVLLDFWAVWCGPCTMLGPVVSNIAEKYEGKIKVGKVNVDMEDGLASAFRVSSIPMLALVKNGEVVKTSVGYMPQDAVEEWLNR